MRDRESLFNEYILEVRRREKDEKIQKKETVSMSIKCILRIIELLRPLGCDFINSKLFIYVYISHIIS